MLTHGDARKQAVTPEYTAWKTMLARCQNPNWARFDYYGGRGITVCKRWLKFENFLADMGRRPSPAHSLERKSNDGNYTPKNCVWATKKEQARNRRSTRLVIYRGETMSIAELAEKTQQPYGRVRDRIVAYGWTPEEAVHVPPQ